MPLDPLALIGKTLGRYRVIERIGGGGMGDVYLAHDLRLGERDVALKVLRTGLLADASARKRFRKEALALSKLNHPNIATVHDFDTQEHVDFLVMEYVGGATLGEKLHSGPLAEKEIARLGVDLAEGLEAAHRQGVIHRDLKPGNVRLTPDGRLKMLDFGLAKLVQPVGANTPVETATQSEDGVLVGTLPYMAPEQLRGEEADARSDLWAAGVVLYELATARMAFPQTDRARLIAAILNEAVPSATSVNHRLSPGMDSIIAKCLEKDPENRYQSAKELAVDLRRLGALTLVQSMRQVQRVRGRRWVGAAAGILVLMAAGVLARNEGWLPQLHPRPSAPDKKDWILVADFDGPSGDPALAVAARELVSGALDQSGIVATVPRDQIQLALEMAGKPLATRVDGKLAKELAYRGAVRTVLEGEIGRLGPGYSAVLRVVDAESVKVVITERAVANNENELIPMLGRLAGKLRADLGERRDAIRGTRDEDIVATPSFEAYRLFLRAERTQGEVSNQKAIPVVREALALDPDFAHAWWLLGLCFRNLGQGDSAVAAFDEALRRPQRLTTSQRLNVEASRAEADEDLQGALVRYQRILQISPTDFVALRNGGATLAMLGRFKEALESQQEVERLSPFGADDITRSNQVIDLFCLGRTEEARRVARYLRGRRAPILRTYIEIAAHNWATVESLATAALANPDLDEDEQGELSLNLASAQAGRGSFKAAAKTLERAEVISQGAVQPIQDMARRARLMLSTVSGGVIPLPADTWARDRSTATLITRGLRATIAEDQPEARILWNEARARPRLELARQEAAPPLLEARIAALSGHWEEAARILQPIASLPVEPGTGSYPAGMSAVRWSLADAFEKLGHPDSAAVYLEKVVSDPAPSLQENHLRGMAWPLAHRRLVVLYARMGRIEDARRHWSLFEETFSRPDPELKPLVEDARAELAKAEEAAHRPVARANASGT